MSDCHLASINQVCLFMTYADQCIHGKGYVYYDSPKFLIMSLLDCYINDIYKTQKQTYYFKLHVSNKIIIDIFTTSIVITYTIVFKTGKNVYVFLPCHMPGNNITVDIT